MGNRKSEPGFSSIESCSILHTRAEPLRSSTPHYVVVVTVDRRASSFLHNPFLYPATRFILSTSCYTILSVEKLDSIFGAFPWLRIGFLKGRKRHRNEVYGNGHEGRQSLEIRGCRDTAGAFENGGEVDVEHGDMY
jgi:hypothetical protein